jgi:hypothetical protein
MKKMQYARATFGWIKGKENPLQISEDDVIARKLLVDAMITIVQSEIMKTKINDEDLKNAWKQWTEDDLGPAKSQPRSWGQTVSDTVKNAANGALGALKLVRQGQSIPPTGAQVRCLTCGLRCHPTSASMGTLYRSVQKQSRKAQLTKEIVF